ncbi:MAG: NUDIX domain-containing protein [Gemmatimonadota bacterium]
MREEWSAGGVVVRMIGGRPHVLLIRDPYRNWGLPKGHIEGEEGEESAALREVREETGLSDPVITADLGVIDWRFRLRGRAIHKYCRFFLMTSEKGAPVPEVSEGITECRWLPVEEAIRGVTYDNAREVLRVAAGVLAGEGAPGDAPGAEEKTG